MTRSEKSWQPLSLVRYLPSRGQISQDINLEAISPKHVLSGDRATGAVDSQVV
jgi:hypothetical protein